MDTKEKLYYCQIAGLQRMQVNARPFEFLWQVFLRIEWAIDRRLKFVIRSISTKRKPRKEFSPYTIKAKLLPGDLVRVKTIEEILDTVNSWNELKGCAFMDEMEAFCGTTQRVFKRVDKFMDERDYRMKRCKGIVLLEDVMCQGAKIFGRCDRSCFFFWREEWLEKIN